MESTRKRQNYCGSKRIAAHLCFICIVLIFPREEKNSELVQQADLHKRETNETALSHLVSIAQ